MHADIGDWLVVNSHSDGRPTRRATILAVGPGGEPPFTVRWLDDEHQAVVFPGPDAEVISAARQSELDRAQTERINRAQSAINTNSIKTATSPNSPTPQ